MHFLASFGLLVIVLGFSGGAWYAWERSGDALIPAGRYVVPVGLACIAIAQVFSWIRSRKLLRRESFTDGRAWALGLFLIFSSDWLGRPWGFFATPLMRGEILLAFGVMFFLLRGAWMQFFLMWPLLAIVLLVWSFVVAAEGRLLFSDDHTMFMLRLRLLRENFPSIPFWSPLWNAGFDARDFFATGALNAFFLAAPALYAFDIEAAYPYLICALLWVVPSISVFAAARLLDISQVRAAIASTLALSSGLFWYRWGLKYGTLGFITSTALFPIVLALAIRHINTFRPSWKLSLALSLCTTLMLLWSPSGVAALPILVVALPHVGRLIRSPRHLLTLALILALNLPWMSMMWKVSKVGRFLDTAQVTRASHGPQSFDTTVSATPPAETKVYRHKAGGVDAKKTLTHWQSNAVALNPLILVFALPAVLTLTRPLFAYFFAVVGWLLILGTLGVSLKPQLELDRMIVMAAMVLTIPVASFLVDLFLQARTSSVWRATATLAGAFLLVGPFATAAIVLNRADDRYTFASPEVDSMVRAITQHAQGGRIFFTGCVLHELSGGHLAPLPLWANTEMVATSYAHNIWRYEQPFPKSYLDRGDDGIQEYLDLMNATLVTAHEPLWIDYFRARPHEYAQVWRSEHFLLFRRLNYQPTPTLVGTVSSLSFSSNSITLTPTSDSLVLKYRYFPFLTASGCTLSPFAHPAGIELIQLSHCSSNTPVTVRSVSPLRRFWSSPS